MTRKPQERAYVLIRVQPDAAEAVLCSLSKSGLFKMVDMVFGRYDLIAVVEAVDRDEISRIIMHHIRSIEGVSETLTCLTIHPSEIGLY